MITLSLLARVWQYLTSLRRLQLIGLLLAMIASALAEIISLGAVLPFLVALANPEKLLDLPLLEKLPLTLSEKSPDELLWFSITFFGLSAIIAAVIRLANIWLRAKITASVGSDLSTMAFSLTLYQPYSVQVSRSSSHIIACITTHIAGTVNAISSLLQLLSSLLIAIAIVIGLCLIDSTIAIYAGLLFGGFYFLLSLLLRSRLILNGQRLADSSNRLYKSLQEGLGAIRDIVLDRLQPIYVLNYSSADKEQRQTQAQNEFIASFPRYTLEALAMVAISIVGYYLVANRGYAPSVVPVLGALALGGQRLLPALQQIYNSWAVLKTSNAYITESLALLSQPKPLLSAIQKDLSFNQKISLRHVSFKYTLDQDNVVTDLSIDLYRGQKVGFVGTTGSGKSTIVDIIMGLLRPISGQVFVDDIDINEPGDPSLIYQWHSAISHVPQSIYLSDATICENIAFGIEREAIDMDRVKQAAKNAMIDSFIDSTSLGYNTVVGERGIRLSGGQRQRIGIARALYKPCSLLVLDEATSALDTQTEKLVMDQIHSNDDRCTMLIIAHRLETLKMCDLVVQIENGKIVSMGSPEEILYK